MASETYYFFFSIILTIGALFWATNLVWFRVFNKTLYGNGYMPGTPENDRVRKLACNRNIAISSIIALGFAANLAYDVHRLLHLKNQSYAHSILIYAPIATVVFSIVMFFTVRKQITNYPFNKQG